MLVMRRVPVSWTTGPGGSGVSVFYTGDSDDVTVQLGTFFNAIKAQMPTGVTWTIPASGDKLQDEDGELAGAWSGGTQATIVGTSNQPYAAGTGAYIRWLTGAVVDKHKLQGRTFLVPLANTAYWTDGEIVSSSLTILQNAATALAAASKLIVWHRPRKAYTSPDGTSHPERVGTNRLVIAATVPNKVTSLRSRRS
jgi:hypothetical protein